MFDGFCNIYRINKGWSADEKYYVEDADHLLALYTAMITLFTVAWAISFGELEVKNSLKRAEMILADYSGFESIYPAWLKSG